MNIIETNQICKKYGPQLVIDHVDMHIEKGSIYGFVGENGSGKTTIMRLLTGLAELTSGSYTLFGINNKDPKIYQYRSQMAAIVEVPSFVPSMTANDNIIYQEKYLGIKLTQEDRDALLKKVHLEDVNKKKVRNFSLGMRQRLAIGLALINKPKILMLDEPMNGLDPEGIVELRELLIELNQKEGITILISSHILSELEKIATCYGFISHGKLLEEISYEDLQKKCRKSIALKVDDVKKAEKILKKYKEYEISPNGDIRIYDEANIKEVVKDFDSVDILAINTADESVEDYYLNLIKGAK